MSKLNYLLIILFLVVVGFLFISQLKLATESAVHLTAAEISEMIDIRITQARSILKRYPDADGEFKAFVLDKLDFSRFPIAISIQKFQPGSAVAPAFFLLVIKTRTMVEPVSYGFYYYGSRYRQNLLFQGQLIRQ